MIELIRENPVGTFFVIVTVCATVYQLVNRVLAAFERVYGK